MTTYASFEDAIAAAERAYDVGDWSGAYDAFARAHDLGGSVRRRHVAAHLGMIRAASHAGRADRVLKNEVLLVAAFLTVHRSG